MRTLCGIIGVALTNNKAGTYIAKGLKRLEYRGYDSVGSVIITSDGRVLIKKQKGDVDAFLSRFKIEDIDGSVGIGHTRWATHGEPSDINAHPHTDCKKTIFIVHNGVVRNYSSLREELMNKKHELISVTDTELIAHVIEEELERSKTFLEALAKAVKRVSGAYALAIIYSKEPDRVYFVKKGNPLVIGISNIGMFIASDIPALLEFARNVVVIEDNEIGWITNNDYKVFRLEEGFEEIVLIPVSKTPIVVEWTLEEAEKGGHPHFMIKEIEEQPHVLASTYNGLVEDPKTLIVSEMIASAEKVLIVGAGSSFNAGLVIAYYLTELAKVLPHLAVSSEFKVYKNVVDKNTLVIAISQSGETYDTLVAIREFKKLGARIIGISNVIGSALYRDSDICVLMRAGPEIGVAATKTYLSQVLVGEIIAIKAARAAGRLGISEEKEQLNSLSLAPSITKRSIEISHKSADPSLLSSEHKSSYILGKGLGGLLAREAALKIKEISYIHAEAYPAGESKHGPIALVERSFPVFFIATSDAEEIGGNIAEMAARKAKTVVVKPKNLNLQLSRDLSELVIEMPAALNILLEPYSLIPFFQILAYRTAVVRGYNPDKPRYLAKTVTVE
ncbi:MAG: glutamine--fructose-6-phosphate transaminase (isomerizing) [Acidilobaceae archaeon]